LKMSSATTAKQFTEVTLLRPDEAPQSYTLPEGATLAALLRAAGAAVRSSNMLIDGRPIEDTVILRTGMMITIVPEPPQGPPEKDWRRTVGTFQDTPSFRAMIAEGRAIREADREATLAELDAEQEDS
jgi:hypothetical protein